MIAKISITYQPLGKLPQAGCSKQSPQKKKTKNTNNKSKYIKNKTAQKSTLAKRPTELLPKQTHQIAFRSRRYRGCEHPAELAKIIGNTLWRTLYSSLRSSLTLALFDDLIYPIVLLVLVCVRAYSRSCEPRERERKSARVPISQRCCATRVTAADKLLALS